MDSGCMRLLCTGMDQALVVIAEADVTATDNANNIVRQNSTSDSGAAAKRLSRKSSSSANGTCFVDTCCFSVDTI